MSFTEHEVGQVPAETDNVDPLIVPAPKHLHYLLVAVISFLVAPAGIILAIVYNQKVTQHNRQVGATKVSAMNFWLTVAISAAIGITAAVATHLPQNNPANAPYIVIGAGPVAPGVQPSQAAPSVPVKTPDNAAAPVAATAPAATVSDSSSSPQGTGDTSVRVAAAKAILADPTTFMETQYAIVDRAYCERDPGLLDQVYTADSSYLPSMKATVSTADCIKTQVLGTEPWPGPTDPATQEIGFYATLSTFNNGEKFSVHLVWDGVQWKTKNG